MYYSLLSGGFIDMVGILPLTHELGLLGRLGT